MIEPVTFRRAGSIAGARPELRTIDTLRSFSFNTGISEWPYEVCRTVGGESQPIRGVF